MTSIGSAPLRGHGSPDPHNGRPDGSFPGVAPRLRWNSRGLPPLCNASERGEMETMANARFRWEVSTDSTEEDVLAMVAHELRRPLQAIAGWAGLLQSGGLPEEQVR